MVKNPFYKTNEKIKSPKVRVIDQKGKQLGVLDTKEALEMAQGEGLDLVEVAPSAKPPVAKILNYKKWLFQREKQSKEGKKEKRSELKELRIGPNIGDHDLERRVSRAEEFLKAGDKVKLTVFFRGRQRAHPEVGLEKINRVTKLLKEVGKPEKDPVRSARGYEVILVPRKRM